MIDVQKDGPIIIFSSFPPIMAWMKEVIEMENKAGECVEGE